MLVNALTNNLQYVSIYKFFRIFFLIIIIVNSC